MVALLLGCKPALKVDIDCPKLCLAEPGPSLPGLARLLPQVADGAVPVWVQLLAHVEMTADGGVASGFVDGIADAYPGISLAASTGNAPALVADWTVEADFDQVLAQVPSAAIDLSAKVRLSAVRLTSTEDLSFLESVEVFLSRGSKVSQSRTATDARALAPSGCKAESPGLPVATFRRPDIRSATPTVEMVIAEPELNLFECMKDAPSLFNLKMVIPAETYPVADTPLTLGACIGVQAQAGYP